MSRPWRLVLDPPGAGAWNMSVDEALLLHVQDQGPTLRLYRWESPTLSLGYRQGGALWAGRCRELGLDVVRRISGGGAVVHAGDLTYAVVAPADCKEVPRGLQGSFGWISALLMDGLRRAGLHVDAARAVPGADRLGVCFAGGLGFEIELQGAKLVGSSQRRLPAAFLQHGSIRLVDDSSWYRAVFCSEVPAPPIPGERVRRELVPSLVETFRQALEGGLVPRALTEEERETARLRCEQRRLEPLHAPALPSSSPPRVADSSA